VSFTHVGLVALHEAFEPSFTPVHSQVQGPEPLTEPAVPALHKFVGADESSFPLSLPHTPFTILGALHVVTLFPPLIPSQLHLNVLFSSLTVVAFPELHKSASGAVYAATLFALPHAPFIFGAQDLLLPPCIPSQVHVHVLPL